MQTFFSFFFLVAVVFNFQNCSKVQFETSQANFSSTSNDEDQEVLFKTFKPALAGRALDCTMCHAKINSDVITDFGYGDSYFLNTELYKVSTGWASIKELNGKLRIPKASLPSSSTSNNLSLKNYVKDSISKSLSSKIEELDSVYIGAPSRAHILTKAPGLAEKSYRYFPAKIGHSLVGLRASNGVDPSIRNDSPGSTIKCEGDVVVHAPLLLDHVKIETQKGCRIYATGPIFVKGSISFSGQNDENLQLLSSNAIYLGANTQNLDLRFGGFNKKFKLVTRDISESNTSATEAIKQTFASIIGAGAPDGNTEYNRLLLNAPHIHNFNSGHFHGAVIAEVVQFEFGNLEFSFDPVFERVPILPLTGISSSLRLK